MTYQFTCNLSKDKQLKELTLQLAAQGNHKLAKEKEGVVA
jgi:hypothetical protein